eukprot:scpid108697/ scgid15810/ 
MATALYMTHLLPEHFPGGAHHTHSQEMQQQTASVRKTSVSAERDFSQLDRFLREKPNVRTVSLEGMGTFSNNRTAHWLISKPEKEQAEILAQARRTASALRRLCGERKKEIQQNCLQQLKEKEDS